MATAQYIQAFRHSQDKVQTKHQNREGDLNEFECGMAVGARRLFIDK